MMRRIKTKEQLEKKQKINQYIIGIVFTVILVFSIFGFGSFSGGDTKENVKREYNGIEFVKSREGWTVQKDGELFYSHYFPDELDNVTISGFYNLGEFAGNPLYFVGKENSVEGFSIITGNIGRYALRINNACVEGIECADENYPTKSCENNIIIFKQTNETEETSVYREENCVYINGNLKKGANAFLYKVLGIK